MTGVVKDFLVLTCSLLFAACANRVPPGGGPVDKTPPVVIGSAPANSSVNFEGRTIEIQFNEYIQLKDGGTGIIISPPILMPPEVTLKGKTLRLKFPEPLDSNTTYTVIIGKSVTDLTEGNALQDFVFVFSTGPLLDSLNLTGSVKDAFTNQFVKDAYVMMYASDEDSLVEKGLPRYFARTLEGGSFTVKNIRQGIYKVVALLDANADYKFNQPEEKIGFVDSLVKIDSVRNGPVNFRIFTAAPSTQKLLRKSYELPGRLNLKYTLGVDEFSLKVLFPADTFSIINEFKPGADSITAWLPDVNTDSLIFVATASQNGARITDTLFFNPQQIKKSRSFKKRGVTAADTTLKVSHSIIGGRIRINDTIALFFSRPVQSVENANIFLLTGKDTTLLPLSDEVKPGARSILLKNFRKPAVPFSFYFLPGAFTDIYGKANDTLKINASVYASEELGMLEFLIQSDDSVATMRMVAELTDKAGKVVSRKLALTGEMLMFPDLLPGNYGLRVILDKDQNGKWSAGDFRKKIQPEEVVYFPGEILMRAGWDQELSWAIDEQSVPGKRLLPAK